MERTVKSHHRLCEGYLGAGISLEEGSAAHPITAALQEHCEMCSIQKPVRRKHALFPGSGMCSVNTGPACCHMPRASESIFLSGLGRVWLRGKALGKYRLDGEYTLLWLKERYPSHTQELDPCPSSSCAPALGGPQKYPPDPPWAALALHPHCVSG